MKTMKHVFVIVLIAMLTVPAFLQASTEDLKTLVASLTLDKKQIGEKVDREIEVAAIAADGFIQGTEGKEKKFILFSDIEEIIWDLNTHSYTVKTWDGKTHVLTWGLIKSENTATAVTFKIKDPKTEKLVNESVSPSEIKRLAFPKPESAK